MWDARRSTAVCVLDDTWQAATGRRAEAGKANGVRALAWVMSGPCLLAVALSGLFVVWDPRGDFISSGRTCFHAL